MLYDIPDEFDDIDADLDGVTPLPSDYFAELINRLPLDWPAQARHAVEWIRNLESQAEALKSEAMRLQAKAASANRKIGYLRNWLLGELQTRQLRNINVGIATPTVQRGSTSIRVDPLLIPQWPDDIRRYCTTTEVSVNRTELKRRAGSTLDSLPGVTIVAGPDRLVIR